MRNETDTKCPNCRARENFYRGSETPPEPTSNCSIRIPREMHAWLSLEAAQRRHACGHRGNLTEIIIEAVREARARQTVNHPV